MGFGLALIALSAEPILYEDIGREEARLSKFMDNLTKNIKFEGILRIYTNPIDKNLVEYLKKPLCKKGYLCEYNNKSLIITDKKNNILLTIYEYWSFQSEGLSLEKGVEIEKVCESLREILAKRYLEDSAAWCAYDRRRLTIIYQKNQESSKIMPSNLQHLLGEKKIMGSSVHMDKQDGNTNFLLFIPRKKYHKGGIQPRFALITNSDDLNWSTICAVIYEWNSYYTKMRHYFIFEDFYGRFFDFINDPRKYELEDIIEFSENLRRFREELRIKDLVASGLFMSYRPVNLTENKFEISGLEGTTALEFLRNHILPSEPGSITHDLSNKVSKMIEMIETFSAGMHNTYTNERNLQIQYGLYIIQLLFVVILPTTIIQTFLPNLAQDEKIEVFMVTAIVFGLILFLVYRRFRNHM